ncbi:carbamoyltransferase HypF [Candidatus Pacearchaeota archaeon]|nr:carbamoyltransferase HypF [Candidatus Pacearchaeota archaeon]
MTMYKFFVKGIVQGVGFRPYIYRKAKENSLTGSVKNIGSGVEIIINDRNFIERLDDLPPLAKIYESKCEKIESKIYDDFSILKSTTSKGETILPADIFTCEDCLRELRDKTNRRHNYYFITCTNCGPRFSMIENYPYDRHLTSMKEFQMCEECKKEYTDPLNRRYHAQTIACKNCGPKLKLISNSKNITKSTDLETIKETISLIKMGEIVSIKGIGGFHVCSLADNETVKKVRKLLNRPNKPFAIIAKNIEIIKQFANISEKEKLLLEDPKRPIVVLEKKNNNDFKEISELNTIGAMLPYTPLHHLIFDFLEEKEVLLMTSCNIPGEPVATKEKITKHFLTHERKIVNRCDDSVIKTIKEKSFYLRRSRGFTPIPIGLPIITKDTIALGSEINNCICTTKNKNAFLSQYIGDTSKLATFEFLKDTVFKLLEMTRLNPKIITCDLHPEYNTTKFAEELKEKYNSKLIPIQHHKAHVASVAAEHNLKDYIGIALDGLGYGEDKNIWGGEIFDVKNHINFQRIGHLEEQPQLGGDSSTIYPKKMLFGILSKFLDEEKLNELNLFNLEETKIYLKQLEQNFNISTTTSAGRILDATAALLGICEKRTYDGRPAMLLESYATNPFKLEPVFIEKEKKKILSTTHLFKFLIKNLNEDKKRLAATAQMYIAKGTLKIAKEKKKPIVLSGGVAYNNMITSYMIEEGVLINKEIPCGDGGLCYGQAYLANLINNKEINSNQ